MQKLFVILLFGFSYFSCSQSTEAPRISFDPFEKLASYKSIIKKRKLNVQYVFVVNYKEHSGRKRLYVIDILHNKIVKKIMVAHGEKSETQTGYATDFSNISGSNKSSLGYAIVNQRAYSKWGTHVKYWLDGISKTNTNMRPRVMVLHSYEYVPDYETYPLPIVTSLGCVMISKTDMTYIDTLIKKQKNKRLLMDIQG